MGPAVPAKWQMQVHQEGWAILEEGGGTVGWGGEHRGGVIGSCLAF